MVFRPIEIYYQNVNGLRTKSVSVSEFVASSIVNYVYCLTETWLNVSCSSCDYFPQSYSVYRNDRVSMTGADVRGGGVLIAVPGHLYSVRRFDLEVDDYCVWVQISSPDRNLLVGVFYMPPGLSLEKFKRPFDILESGISKFNGDVYLLGDFNLPHVNWPLLDCSHGTPVIASKFMTLSTSVSFLGLRQCNGIANRFGVYLDLVFSNAPQCEIIHPDFYCVAEDIFHPVLTFNLDMPHVTSTCSSDPPSKFNFSKGDYPLFISLISLADWSNFFTCGDVNLCVERFTQIVTEAMEISIPRGKIRHSSFPEWYSKELRVMLCKKKRIHKRFVKFRRFEDYTKFSDLRVSCKRLLKRDRCAQFTRIADGVKCNPAAFWKFLSPRFREAYFDVSLKIEDTLISDSPQLCHAFGKFFESTVSQSLPTDSSCFSSLNNNASPVDVFLVTESSVISAAKRLRPLKGVGPDGIPQFLVKGCILILAPFLAHIYNLSFSSGVFPSLWKEAVVFPVFKSGSRLEITNYRPISNLCACAKLFEYVVADALIPWMKNFLSEDQFGFVAGRSIELNLMSLLFKVAPCLFSRSQFDVIYLDFAKAFDMVNHALLLIKLGHYGMSKKFVAWFESFLKNRTFVVLCNGVIGNTKYNVLSGVIQGSVLGPLLFLIFINDLLADHRALAKWLFADDTKAGREIRTLFDCHVLQMVLDDIHRWSCRNGMRLNASKSAVVSFTRKATFLFFNYFIDGVVIPRCEVQRDLGILFDPKLVFRHHVLKIIVDCNRYLGVLYRISYTFDSWLPLKTLYVTLVLSKISFASVIWAGCAEYLRDKIEGIQRRFVQIIHRRFFSTEPYNYVNILRKLGLLTIKEHLLYRDCLLLYSIVNGTISAPQQLASINFRVSSRTRLGDLFYITDHFQIMSRLCEQFNSFSSTLDIFALTKWQFRSQLFALLCNRS